MLSLKDFPKVLLEYVRTPDYLDARVRITPLGATSYLVNVPGKRIGVIVATEEGVLGWSLCCKRDVFDKKLGIHIALNRASIAKSLSKKDRESYYEMVPQSIKLQFDYMLERSSNQLSC